MTPTATHVLNLVEWSEGNVPGARLSARDRELASKLSTGDRGRLIVEELSTGLRIRSTSWIGVVGFDEVEVHVLPKLAGDHLRVLEMIDRTMCLDALRRSPGLRDLDADGANLLDLFVLLLVEECERILRGGLLADYLEEEGDLPVLRGRLLVARQVRERPGRMDRLLCRFDDRREDVLENQILATALTLCAPRVRHAGVALRARRLGAIFREACEGFAPDIQILSEEVAYNRLNQHYEPAHDLARFVAGRAGVSDLFAAGSASCFAFLLDMNRLFERFVELVVRRILRGSSLRAQYQYADRSILWDADAGRSYGRVIPDMLIEERGGTGRLAIDAKYKSYDSRKLDSSDIYQAFLYAYAFRGARHSPTALLLYPSMETAGSGVHLRVRTGRYREEADLLVCGLHIPSILAEIDRIELGPACITLRDRIRERCGSEPGALQWDGAGRVGVLGSEVSSFESSHA